MKFEESSLTQYLVKNLQPLTPADPVILAKYVVALLKKDKPIKELHDLCTKNLVDFLGQSTDAFITDLFQAIESGSVVRPIDDADTIKKSEPSSVALDQVESISSKGEEQSRFKRERGHSSSSGDATDSEDQEVSDDDDDRNHKHRKRDARPQSFENDNQGELLRRPNRRLNKTTGNGQQFEARNTAENKNLHNPSFERDFFLKFEKRLPGMASLSRAQMDIGQRTRTNQSRSEPGPHIDLSTAFSRPGGGRGRGWGIGPWGQHDSRFSPIGTLDFSSHMASQGPHPSLFVGNSLPNAVGTQNASWGSFGFVPGMANACIDPLNPLGLPGALHAPINPQMNLNVPRQRCRDFEEQGFCLRGDMCPMEHGVNRIVVEDVQSLSQFNLPVSLATTHSSGLQGGAGTLTSTNASSSLLKNKSLPNKISRSGVTDERLNLNGVMSSTAGGDSDVYDPDQPLWNNDPPESSHDLLKVPPPNVAAEPLWDGDPSELRNFDFPDSVDSVRPSTSSNDDINSQRRGCISLGNKLKMSGAISNIVTATGHVEKETNGAAEERNNDHGVLTHGRLAVTTEANHKTTNSALVGRFRKDHRRIAARTSQKALRTLFVNGIPQQNNKKGALLSHFQKFGNVIDIYIPQNSEKAFVQFSKREEAESALKSPDAVMGNRFIKLFWANRDNVADEKEGREEANLVGGSARATPLFPYKPSSTGGTESHAPKTNSAPPVDTSVPATIHSKPLAVSITKAIPLPQKKRESLEFLKEELRRKQESLEQKRNDFKNQLDKLEKQTASVKKGGTVVEKAVKKQKVETDADSAKASMPKPLSFIATGEYSKAEKALDISSSQDDLGLSKSKADSAMPPQPAWSSVQTNNVSVPSVNRFKLDNRPTGFRILPPLPTDFANVDVIKEHFSAFHDLSVVELEDVEVKSGSECSNPLSSSARIIFMTRHSAERAFQTAGTWQGQKLKFVWLTVLPNSANGPRVRRMSPDTNVKEVSASGCKSELMTVDFSLSSAQLSVCKSDFTSFESSSSSEKMPTCNDTTVGFDATDSKEHVNVDSTDSVPGTSTEAQSSPPMSSPDKCPPCSAVPVIEDGIDVGFSQ